MAFKEEDVIILAKVVMEDAVCFQDGGDCRQDGYECYQCRGEQTDTREEFKHEIDCPVLVAQDVLTGVL